MAAERHQQRGDRGHGAWKASCVARTPLKNK
jgi:hypothetical protein